MKKAYYTDPQKSEFVCRIEEKITLNDKTYYLFDIFPFYPGGGGEEADSGSSDGKALDECLESGENVYYSFSEDIGNVGDSVSCHVDIPLRNKRSIMHTSQHILSAILCDVFGLPTDSVHFSEDYATIDLTGEITPENLRYTEDKANEIVRSCINVNWEIVDPSELKNLPLRKVMGDVDSPRVVSIPSVDMSLCCAVHVRNTGNIGLIKILKTERKADKLRITFTSGQSAVDDYDKKNDVISKINAHLSSTTENVYERVLKKDDEISSLKKQMSGLRDELMAFELEKFIKSPLTVITKEGDINELKKLAAALTERAPKAFIGIDRNERKLLVYQSINRPVNAAINELKGVYDIRGGGNTQSGQLMCGEKLDEVIKALIVHFSPAENTDMNII